MALLLLAAPLTLTMNLRAQETGLAGSDGEPATAEAPAVDPRLQSPQDTMFTFLDAIGRAGEGQSGADRRAALDEAIACLDISGVPAEGAASIAAKLVQILDRLGTVERWQLPDARGSSRIQRFEGRSPMALEPPGRASPAT